jgi:hypothetical protein
MRAPTIRSALPLSLALLALSGRVTSAAAPDVCDVRGASRIVAVGDVHGAYDNFVEVLQMTGLVDEDARWVGGETHLVQTGDVLDYGPDTRKVLDLLMRLEEEAAAAGGRVHALLGNHEVMNLLGDVRFVVPAEYETFTTPESEERREELIQEAVNKARARARAQGAALREESFRARLKREIPLGFVERQEAFSPEGVYGRWLRQRAAVARVNHVVFLHGGLTPQVAALGCEAIDETVHRELTTDVEKTREAPLESLVAAENGPLWYRGLAREDETSFAASVDQVLQAMDARAIVVAHTVTKTGRIQSRFGGRVVMIDAGMAPHYGGRLAALEIDSTGRMTAVYPDSREVLETPGAASPAPEAEELSPVGRS